MDDSRDLCLHRWDRCVGLNVQYAPLVKHMHIIQLFRIGHVYDIED